MYIRHIVALNKSVQSLNHVPTRTSHSHYADEIAVSILRFRHCVSLNLNHVIREVLSSHHLGYLPGITFIGPERSSISSGLL